MGAFTRGSGVRASSGDVGNAIGGRLGAGAGATAAKLSGWPRTCSTASKCPITQWFRNVTKLFLHPPSASARASTWLSCLHLKICTWKHTTRISRLRN